MKPPMTDTDPIPAGPSIPGIPGISYRVEIQAALLALSWYQERATSLARYMARVPTNTDAALAVMEELALDAGQRATAVSPAALRALAALCEEIERRERNRDREYPMMNITSDLKLLSSIAAGFRPGGVEAK